MDHSPLARLPPELRNKIYEIALTQEKPVARFHPYISRARDHCTHRLALTRTCKQIHAESSQLFYSCNTFKLIAQSSDGKALTCLDSLVSRLGEANTAAMRRLQINLFMPHRNLSSLRSILGVVREIRDRRGLMAECWIELRFRVHAGGFGEHLSLVWDPRGPQKVENSRQQCMDRIDTWEAKGKAGNSMLQLWSFLVARDLKAVLKEV